MTFHWNVSNQAVQVLDINQFVIMSLSLLHSNISQIWVYLQICAKTFAQWRRARDIRQWQPLKVVVFFYFSGVFTSLFLSLVFIVNSWNASLSTLNSQAVQQKTAKCAKVPPVQLPVNQCTRLLTFVPIHVRTSLPLHAAIGQVTIRFQKIHPATVHSH